MRREGSRVASWTTHALSRAALGAALALLAACGPIRGGATLVDAAAELKAAETAQAADKAPYEYFAAEAYLHKAREDHSYANFQTAERFAKKSRDCARAARAIAEAATRSDIGASVASIPPGVVCRAGSDRARERRGGVPTPLLGASQGPRPTTAPKAGEPKDPTKAGEPRDPSPVRGPAAPAPVAPARPPVKAKPKPKGPTVAPPAAVPPPKGDEPLPPGDEPLPEGDAE